MEDSRENNHEKDEDSDEVEDYMSNDFLKKIPDTRPGLVHSKIQVKKIETEKKHRQSNARNLQESSKNLEKINRDEALNKSSLTDQNKGFSLMKKMGYKTGEALGRSKPNESKSSVNIEPISVEIKLDRGGLGQVEERKRKLKEIETLKKRICESRIYNEKQTAQIYLENKRAKFNLRKLIHNLHKCQKVCYQLDSDKDLKKPEVKWFWPINVRRSLNQTLQIEKQEQAKNIETIEQKKDEVKEEFYEKIITNKEDNKDTNMQTVYDNRLEEFISENSSVKVVDYYESDTNSEKDEDKDVKEEKPISDTSDNDDEEEDDNEFNEEVLRKKIDVVCSYLKENYFYCVWCATKYNNDEDIAKNCPGSTEDDHDD